MNELATFAAKGSPFIKFDENNQVTGKYLGYKIEEDPFQKGEMRVSYHFALPDGSEKEFGTSSKRLATAMAPVTVGEHITITRAGSGFNTTYAVVRLSGVTAKEAENNPTPSEDPIPTPIEAPIETETVNPDDVPF